MPWESAEPPPLFERHLPHLPFEASDAPPPPSPPTPFAAAAPLLPLGGPCNRSEFNHGDGKSNLINEKTYMNHTS